MAGAHEHRRITQHDWNHPPARQKMAGGHRDSFSQATISAKPASPRKRLASTWTQVWGPVLGRVSTSPSAPCSCLLEPFLLLSAWLGGNTMRARNTILSWLASLALRLALASPAYQCRAPRCHPCKHFRRATKPRLPGYEWVWLEATGLKKSGAPPKAHSSR